MIKKNSLRRLRNYNATNDYCYNIIYYILYSLFFENMANYDIYLIHNKWLYLAFSLFAVKWDRSLRKQWAENMIAHEKNCKMKFQDGSQFQLEKFLTSKVIIILLNFFIIVNGNYDYMLELRRSFLLGMVWCLWKFWSLKRT